MLERIETALRTDEWPDIKVPPRVLSFLKNQTERLPEAGPDRRSLQSHFALKQINGEVKSLLDDAAQKVFALDLQGFRDTVVSECRARLAQIDWPEGWFEPETIDNDKRLIPSLERNISLGLTIITSLYLGLLEAYQSAHKPPDYQTIEKLTLKTARRLMQLDDSSGVVNSVEKVLGCFEFNPAGIFEVSASGAVDITAETQRQLAIIMRFEPDIINLLALERCPAFHHAFINRYVGFLTQLALGQMGVKDSVQASLAP